MPESSSADNTPAAEDGSGANNFATPLSGSDKEVIDLNSSSVAAFNNAKKYDKSNIRNYLFDESDGEGSASYSQVVRGYSAVASRMHSENSSQAGSSNQAALKLPPSASAKPNSTKSKTSARSDTKTQFDASGKKTFVNAQPS